MRPFLALLLSCVSLVSGAAVDCTFDQTHQASIIAAVAARFPGGTVELSDRLVTWTSPSEGMTTFAYGGCEDLGSEVTRSTPLSTPRTHSQVFSIARELATKFWSNDIVSARLATEAVVAGLSASKYTMEETDEKQIFSVADPHYVELYVEHEYKGGIDRVTIGWQGNF